ncbi:MAG: hypothetical protein H6557_02310 [Lewinellaceae bacterium]|nr:hypothetical protein [Lewinellaceae bacterium]
MELTILQKRADRSIDPLVKYEDEERCASEPEVDGGRRTADRRRLCQQSNNTAI